jgi:di/tricarboxylate transporter
MIVSGAGGYRVRDFLRAGLPLTVAMLIVTMLLVNVFFG